MPGAFRMLLKRESVSGEEKETQRRSEIRAALPLKEYIYDYGFFAMGWGKKTNLCLVIDTFL